MSLHTDGSMKGGAPALGGFGDSCALHNLRCLSVIVLAQKEAVKRFALYGLQAVTPYPDFIV